MNLVQLKANKDVYRQALNLHYDCFFKSQACQKIFGLMS